MNETFAATMNRPGAFVPIDPRLEALLAINLLDEEPDAAPRDLEPARFHRPDRSAEERIPVLVG